VEGFATQFYIVLSGFITCVKKNKLLHGQGYFSYIMAVSFIGRGTGVPRENHLPAASH
jgi:hypothetical protein